MSDSAGITVTESDSASFIIETQIPERFRVRLVRADSEQIYEVTVRAESDSAGIDFTGSSAACKV